jgi:hypothetical protein
VKITAEPRSDQWNAEDFIGSPRTFTVAGVRAGTAEQKYDILLEGEARCWRPPLTVLRLLMAGWGDDSTVWIGRRVTLFNDESVRFGKEATGGIRVSHMSDLPDGKPLRKSLTETRGKRKTHVIEPLVEAPAPAPVSLDGLDADGLRALWKTADPVTRKAIEARVAELAATEAGGAA